MKTIVFVFLLMVGNLFAQPFEVLQSGVTNHLGDVAFINSNVGYVASNDGTYLQTTNSGTSWNVVSTGSSYFLTSFFFIDENMGYAVGQGGKVLKTTNAGLSWGISTPTGNTLRSVYFLDALNGYAVGDHSTVIKTTDAGSTWNSQSIPLTDASLTGIMFVENNKGYITVAEGLTNLLTTNNSGNSWTDGKVRGGVILGCALDFNGQNGYLAGFELMSSHYYPLVFRTTNNGQTWDEYLSSSQGQLYDIAVSPSNPNKICAVGKYVNDPTNGNKGLIMRSIDGGVNWTEESWGTNQDEFRGVEATTIDFFITGRNGVILKTAHTTGISNVNSLIPEGYTLSQNYPNPFNPTTNIKFSIPKSGNVKLTVYNIAGQEVKVLLNQNLNVGNYVQDFDATNISSGTYFYSLEAIDFKQTKRMVLLK